MKIFIKKSEVMNANNVLNNFKYHKIVVLLYLTITGIPIISGSVINYGLFGLISISIFVLLITNKGLKIRNNNYLKWIIPVVIILFLSVLWVDDVGQSLGRLTRISLIVLFCIYITFLVKDKADFNTALKLFLLSRLIMVVYLLTVLDFSTLGEVRIGADNLGEEWNANSIGMNLALAAFSAFFILKMEKNKLKVKKLIYMLSIALFIIIIVFTGSRKALFIFVFSVGLFSLLNKDKNKFTKLGFLGLVLILVGYISLNNPFLYNVLGSRIEGLFASFTGEGKVDASTSTRMNMINAGITFFEERPLFGHGIDSFRQIYFNYVGDYRYSHNNYVELLVSVGIFGTVIYYLGLLSILKKTFKKTNPYLIFSFVVIVTILIIDYGLVSYTSY